MEIALTLVILMLGIVSIFLVFRNLSSKEIKQWPKHAKTNTIYTCISSWQESYWSKYGRYYSYYAMMKEELKEEYILFETLIVFERDKEYKISYKDSKA